MSRFFQLSQKSRIVSAQFGHIFFQYLAVFLQKVEFRFSLTNIVQKFENLFL